MFQLAVRLGARGNEKSGKLTKPRGEKRLGKIGLVRGMDEVSDGHLSKFCVQKMRQHEKKKRKTDQQNAAINVEMGF